MRSNRSDIENILITRKVKKENRMLEVVALAVVAMVLVALKVKGIW